MSRASGPRVSDFVSSKGEEFCGGLSAVECAGLLGQDGRAPEEGTQRV